LPYIDFPQLLIAFGVLLFSLTVHESAHAWTADRLGDSTARHLGRVSLNPLVHIDPIGTVVFPLLAMVGNLPVIGWAKPVPVDTRNLQNARRDYLFVAAAGPASNLVLALVASMALRVLPVAPATLGEMNISVPAASILSRTLELNVLLAIFNMVPIPPLDGGTVLAGLLPHRVADAFDAVMRPYGFLVLYALLLTGALWAVVAPPYSFLMSWLL
jgi:Zn-dependent protease